MTTAHGDGGPPTVPVQVLPWQAHTASAVGAGHLRDGRPNQDSVGRRLMARADGSAVLVTVVADGHGDPRHFRSARGSAMAVEVGLAAVEAWTIPSGGGAGAVRDHAAATLVPDIVARWNAAVAADLSATPFSDEERAVLARQSLPDVIAYGSTLLLAAFTADFAVFTQIGDGDIVAVRPDGQFLSPVPGDDELNGWQTTSLCQTDAVESFRTGAVALAGGPLFAVLLATDGFGNAQVDDPWPPGFAADLVQLGQEHGPGWFAGQLPDWAQQCASLEGSGDDATMALIVRSAGPASPSPGPAATTPAATTPTAAAPAPASAGAAVTQVAPIASGPAGAPEPAPPSPGSSTKTMPVLTAGLIPPGSGRSAPSPGPATRPGQPTEQWPTPPAAYRGPAGRAGSAARRPRLWWPAAVAVLILAVIALIFVLSHHGQPKPGPVPKPTPVHHTSSRPRPSPSKAHGHKTHPKPRPSHHHRKSSTRPQRNTAIGIPDRQGAGQMRSWT